MSEPLILGAVGQSATLRAGTHYSIAWQASVNLQGAALTRELETGPAGEIGLELASPVNVQFIQGMYLHQAVFSVETDRSATAVRAAVAGAANRAGAPRAVDPLAVVIFTINEAEYQRRTGIGAPIFAAIESGERVADAVRSDLRRAMEAFGAMGGTMARIATWIPIAAGLAAGGVLLALFWPEIRAGVRGMVGAVKGVAA